MKTIIIFGANSAMAKAWARLIADQNCQLILAGRNQAELEKNANDIQLRSNGPKPDVVGFDSQKTEAHGPMMQAVIKKHAVIDEAYLFFGAMSDQTKAQKEFQLAQEMMVTNYVGTASILEIVAAQMEKQKKGLIVGVSSVAGDRGRQSNYIYGSSKAAMSTYLQGLRNRLYHAGVHVMTVKPGFVDSPMTSHLKKGLLMVSPQVFAKGLKKAVRQKKNQVYIPWFWQWIMFIIKSIPEQVFKKLKM